MEHRIHGKKEFWRSRLFWLGVPGLVFLVWAWAISFNSLYVVEWTRDLHKVSSLAIGRGNFVVYGWRTDFTAVPALEFFKFDLREQWPAAAPFPEPWRIIKGDDHSVKEWQFEIGLWFLVLIYFIGWVTLFTWWQRRKRRLSTPQIPAA